MEVIDNITFEIFILKNFGKRYAPKVKPKITILFIESNI